MEPNAEGPEPTEAEEEQAATGRQQEEDAMRYPGHEEDRDLDGDE